MAIDSYTEEAFGQKLGLILSASSPIHSIEYLKGRDKELDTIRKSLYAPGRHIFIFGDRGVGKSSLGQTAAFQYQSSDAAPIFVSGSPNDTFNTVIANIVYQALNHPRTESIKRTESLSVGLRDFKFSAGHEQSGIDIAEAIKSIGDAVELLSQVASKHSERPIVVIDEFDAILDASERNKFAALLKQLGDRSINLKFIFTGIGKSLDELLGAHQSAYRQIEAVELPRLSWDARREIVLSAVRACELGLDDNVNWRIAQVSDGFPYYIHLITEKILWAAFSADELVTDIGQEHFRAGLADAIVSTAPELKRPYEKAVLHRAQEFEDIVWAASDQDDLMRSLQDIYESYKVVVEKRKDERKPIDRARFTNQMRKLKEPQYGSVLQLESGRSGWYSYCEKMLRGYARMQAEANGIELTGERPSPKQTMHIGNVRSGYRGPSIPQGVRTGRSISSWNKRD